MVLPWLNEPVMLHSSRTDTCKLTPAQCEYRRRYWRYWYEADHVYGHAAVYFMCAVIGVFTLSNILSRISRRSKSKGSLAWERGLASSRFFAYKTFYVPTFSWYSPSVGIALTLGPQPYYWPNTRKLSYGSSPPIATRTGYMSLALLPFVMLLSSKSNYITLFTGISHEKLQVFHRWTSWVMFVLALIHTFPFIVFHVWKGDMMMQWNMSAAYWTGVAALIPQAYLNIMSIGPIRNRYYEFFKYTHWLAIGFFVFFFFIHCDFRLTSWDYFIAALSMYGATLVFSFLRTSINSLDANARFLILPDGTIRVTIPTKMSWKPGQHVFLRFWALGLHAMTMHPFTICSLPLSKKMVFYVKPSTGLTIRLKALIENCNGHMPMSIDGPYGDREMARKLGEQDKVMLIAGGSGAGYLFGLLESILQSGSKTDVRVVIAVRHSDSASWILEAVEDILGSLKGDSSAKIEIHITDSEAAELEVVTTPSQDEISSWSDADVEKTVVKTVRPLVPSHNGVSVIRGQGRPDLKELIGSTTVDAPHGSSVGVAGCGPASMMLDVRNSCADAQGRILRGVGGSREVWLHTESFSW